MNTGSNNDNKTIIIIVSIIAVVIAGVIGTVLLFRSDLVQSRLSLNRSDASVEEANVEETVTETDQQNTADVEMELNNDLTDDTLPAISQEEELLSEYIASLNMIDLTGTRLGYVRGMGVDGWNHVEAYNGPVGYVYSDMFGEGEEAVAYSLYLEQTEPCEVWDDQEPILVDTYGFYVESAHVDNGSVVTENCYLGYAFGPNVPDDYHIRIYIKDNYVIYYLYGVACLGDGELIRVIVDRYENGQWETICNERQAGSCFEEDYYPEMGRVADVYSQAGLSFSSANAMGDIYMPVMEERDGIGPIYKLDADNPKAKDYTRDPVITITTGTNDAAATEEPDVTFSSDFGSYSDYILPEVNSRYYDQSEIEALTDGELRLARNEIYARHGRRFTSADLQDYFSSKNWYTPEYAPDDFDRIQESILNDYEIYNRDLIVSIENRR